METIEEKCNDCKNKELERICPCCKKKWNKGATITFSNHGPDYVLCTNKPTMAEWEAMNL
jgi:hypothetical protein